MKIHPTALVEDDVEIGSETAVWDNAHIRTGATIGAHCIIGEKSYIAYDVSIGDLVKINGHVSICTGVTIEDGCMIAAHAVFTNDRTPRATDPETTQLRDSAPDESTERTTVRRGATIGANATIGPGLELGTFCMVGMGAVVTRDVPPFTLVVGNPARVAGLVRRDGELVWRAETGSLPDEGTRLECGDGTVLEMRDGAPRLVE